MNSILGSLIKSSIDYTYAAMDKFEKQHGRRPTKEELKITIEMKIHNLLSTKDEDKVIS